MISYEISIQLCFFFSLYKHLKNFTKSRDHKNLKISYGQNNRPLLSSLLNHILFWVECCVQPDVSSEWTFLVKSTHCLCYKYKFWIFFFLYCSQIFEKWTSISFASKHLKLLTNLFHTLNEVNLHKDSGPKIILIYLKYNKWWVKLIFFYWLLLIYIQKFYRSEFIFNR